MTGAARTGAGMLVVWLGLVVLIGAACRAPGEPPRHPGTGVYRDIIRREAGSTHSALATARIVMSTADSPGLPQTYARVALRSTAADLQHVVIDLQQITPPPAARAPQKRLRAIAGRDAVLLVRVREHWDDRALRRRALQQVTRDAEELDRTLENRLER